MIFSRESLYLLLDRVQKLQKKKNYVFLEFLLSKLSKFKCSGRSRGDGGS